MFSVHMWQTKLITGWLYLTQCTLNFQVPYHTICCGNVQRVLESQPHLLHITRY